MDGDRHRWDLARGEIKGEDEDRRTTSAVRDCANESFMLVVLRDGAARKQLENYSSGLVRRKGRPPKPQQDHRGQGNEENVAQLRKLQKDGEKQDGAEVVAVAWALHDLFPIRQSTATSFAVLALGR